MDFSLIITFIILILLLLFVLGLIWPKKFAAFFGGPHRGKAFLYLIPAFVLLLFLGGQADKLLMKKIQESPEEVTTLNLSNKSLKSTPEYLPTLVNLEELNLENNYLETVPEDIKSLENLRWLKLSDNPIKELPEWLEDMESLTWISLENTKLDSSNFAMLDRMDKKGINVDLSSKTQNVDDTAEEELQQEDEHSEGFWSFAKRQVLGGEESQRRVYGENEIYYDGYSHDLIDTLASALEEQGIFKKDGAVSVKLVKRDQVHVLQIVTIYSDEEDINEEQVLAWQFLGIMIKAKVFPEEDMLIELCDDSLELLKRVELE